MSNKMYKNTKLSTILSSIKGQNPSQTNTNDRDTKVTSNLNTLQINDNNYEHGVENNSQLIIEELTRKNNNLLSIIKHKNHYIKQLKQTIEELEKSIDCSLNNVNEIGAENENFGGSKNSLKPHNHR